MVVGSNPTGPNTQSPENKAVTKTGESSGKSENENLVSGLFSDPDFRLIAERWPELPEHIKAAVKALVETSKATGKHQDGQTQ